MDDFDYLKGSRSRLRMGATLSARRDAAPRADGVREPRGVRRWRGTIPGGTPAFVAAMNAKAAALGMTRTRYEDPTGLSPRNVSTANDLARLVRAAADYPLIREYSTTPEHFVEVQSTGQTLGFNNSNALVKNGDVGHPVAEDRLHPRSRALRRDARDDREPADGDRAARLDRQVRAAGRRAARQALARDRRGAAAARGEDAPCSSRRRRRARRAPRCGSSTRTGTRRRRG